MNGDKCPVCGEFRLPKLNPKAEIQPTARVCQDCGYIEDLAHTHIPPDEMDTMDRDAALGHSEYLKSLAAKGGGER